jgi:hypothetical protein
LKAQGINYDRRPFSRLGCHRRQRFFKAESILKPEHPPPVTKTRNFSSGLPSSSLRAQTFAALVNQNERKKRKLLGNIHGASNEGSIF